MKLRYLLFFVWMLVCFAAVGQDSLKTNLVIFADAGIGIPVTDGGGIQGNLSLNYQTGKSLFTVRAVGIQKISFNFLVLTPVTVLPTLTSDGSQTEYSLLYGRRFIKGGHSFSISLGASVNNRTDVYYDNTKKRHEIYSSYAGLPFEANVLWFKPRKDRFRIYGIIPVGMPTVVGGSFGFKLSGNVSQHSYASLGLVFGFGVHKVY